MTTGPALREAAAGRKQGSSTHAAYPLDLLALQAEVLAAERGEAARGTARYTHDAAGRLLRVNEQDGDLAPRFFLGLTLAGNLWRCRHDLPPDLVRDLERLAAEEPVAADLRDRPRNYDRIRALLGSHAPITDAWHGPAYHFPDAPLAPPAGVVRVTAANGELLRPAFADLIPELDWRQPCLAVVEGGAAVSVCFSSRNHPRAAEAGVETIEAARGRGHAARAVDRLGGGPVRAEGRIPLYSTSWDNVASQGAARRLGLVLYGADLSLT